MGDPVHLFLFAHQDDEFAVFWELHRLIQCGSRVAVVYLTSGSFSGAPSPIRDAESIAVLKKIGIMEKDVHFPGRDIGIPDGGLPKHLERGFRAAVDVVEQTGFIQRIYCPAWEGGHQDHDAVHLIALALNLHLGMTNECLQFPLYTGAGLPSILFRLFFPLPENGAVIASRIPWKDRLRFIRYSLSYPSQRKTWVGLFPFFLLHHLFSGTQIFQPVSLSRASRIPHEGKLLYERRGFYDYADFARDADDFIRRFFAVSPKVPQ